jgi:serine/threonine protein phosphatase 1
MKNYQVSYDKPTRIIIIGDVHGCIDELNELIQILDLNQHDHVIFIGDLIDRGPDSYGVILKAISLAKKCNLKLVLGNHEEKLLRFLHHLSTGSGNETKMSGVEEFYSLTELIGEDEINFLKTAFYSIFLPDQNLLLLHGGIPGSVKYHMPESYPYTNNMGKLCPGIELLTKTRYLDEQGRFVGLEAGQPQYQFWAEQYDGRFGHVVFGHNPFLLENPKTFPFATGIDTGCVYGGWLSALIIENATGAMSSVSVKAKYTYFKNKQYE